MENNSPKISQTLLSIQAYFKQYCGLDGFNPFSDLQFYKLLKTIGKVGMPHDIG